MKSMFFSPATAYRCGVLILATLLLAQASWATTTIKPRIIGGSDATLGQFPWQVGIYTLTTDTQGNALSRRFVCGGTIIHARWILTAAHCLSRYGSNETGFIMAGSIEQDDIFNNSVDIKSQIKHWIIHPGYNSITVDNDIALIELETAIDLTACGTKCQIIQLITAQNVAEGAIAISTPATVSGWGDTVGITGQESYPNVLKYADLNIQDCLASPSLYTTVDITPNMLCASVADYSKDACQGDSGGPLVVANPNGTGKLLAGIVSWGGTPEGSQQHCANTNLPGVYTKVANYSDWISTYTERKDTGVGGNPSGTLGGGGVNLLCLMAIVIILRRRFLHNLNHPLIQTITQK